MTEPRPQVCGESESWGAELALGLLSGPERATGVSHLAACPICREQVDGMARVADQLLLLVPEAEPPAGFESRVLNAVGTAAVGAPAVAGIAPGAHRRHRRGRLVGLVAASVVLVAIGGGVVANVVDRPSGGEAESVYTGLAVSASGRTSCRVVVTGSGPASVLVSLDGYPGPDTDVTVDLETLAGTAVPLGALHVAGGHGLLVRTVDLDADDIRLMRMLSGDGRVIYEAALHDTSGP